VHSDGSTDGLAIEEDWRLLEFRVGEDVVESCLRIELDAAFRGRPLTVSVAAAGQPAKEVGERGEKGTVSEKAREIMNKEAHPR
jgi:hypothetical protein